MSATTESTPEFTATSTAALSRCAGLLAPGACNTVCSARRIVEDSTNVRRDECNAAKGAVLDALHLVIGCRA